MKIFSLVEDLCRQIHSTIVILPSQHPTKKEFRSRIARIKAITNKLKTTSSVIDLTLLRGLYDEVWVLNEQVKYQEITPSYTIKMTHCKEKITYLIQEITHFIYEHTFQK